MIKKFSMINLEIFNDKEIFNDNKMAILTEILGTNAIIFSKHLFTFLQFKTI